MVRKALVFLALCALAQTTFTTAQTNASKTIVTYPSAYGVSQPLSELPIEQSIFGAQVMPEPRPGPLRSKAAAGLSQQPDPALQTEVGPMVSASNGILFDGITSPGYVPSDSNLAVGPNDIVEVVNVQFEVYNKSGAALAGPTNIQNLFTPLGGDCGSGTYGDPVVLYDRAADRWVISMIGSGATTSECMAVSGTNDPTGAYYLYGYSFGANLNDYPKLGTWATTTNSAYLATYNIFGSLTFLGADICAFDRTKMLAGVATAAQLCQMTPSNEFGYLPSDMDGPTPPTDGTPGLFITWQNNNPGQLYLRKLTLNFATASATLSSPTTVSVANSNLACGNGGTCVPQLGTTQTLDSLGDRLMYRFAIRHFSDHDRAVINHSVASTTNQIGIRWYELYDPAGTVTVNQQGTYAPADTTYRWMASLAEDQKANIGLGYSASSATVHPEIVFTGRVPTDPAGIMEAEDIFKVGAGSQSGSSAANRWGDYTAMQVDPSDDCTFWYVAQYEQTSGVFNWHTSIASFVFTGCTGGGGGPVVSLTPTSLTWGKVVLNSTSTVKAVTLSNTGTATLNIASIVPSGDFALTTSSKPCGSTLAAGSSCVIKVTFTPTQLGTRTGKLTITDNASNSPQAVSLSGTGALPATLTPASATFASQTVGTSSVAKVFTLTNNLSVALGSIVISASGDFNVSSTTCTTSLAAKSKCSISVVFKPTATGTRPGALSVIDTATNSPQKSTLAGTGK